MAASHPEHTDAYPGPAPKTSPPARPKEPDWDDYWAHKVAEKAKSRVLTYFGLATLFLTLLGIKGLDEVRKGIEDKFEKEIARKEREASERVSKMLKDFEIELESSVKQVAQRRDEAIQKMSVLPPAYRDAASAPAAAAPVLIDLSQAIGRIRDQGSEGATVGFSVSYALQAAIARKFGQAVEISAQGVYDLARKHDEFPGVSYEGTSVNGALIAARTVGVYLESQWPYQGPAPAASVKPVYRVVTYKDLGRKLDPIIAALQAGKVPIVTLTITSDFDKPTAEGRVVVTTPLRELGGHSMAVVGYDQAKAEFRLANMWGANWGAKGFAVVRDSDLTKILVAAHTIDDVASVN